MSEAHELVDPAAATAAVRSRREQGRGWAIVVVALAAVVVAGCPASGTSQGAIAAELSRTARDHGVRVALAGAIGRVEAALAAGQGERAAEVLEAAWPLGARLADDRVLRDGLRALPATAVPAALAPARAVEDAQDALEDGRPEVAQELLRRSRATATTGRRTALRWGIVHALATLARDPVVARSRLSRLANERVGAGDRLASELLELARITVAASWLDDGDLKEAIAAFLRVEATSGYWRQARFGLATCQLRAGRPQSALKVMALLPGGLVAEPERALMSAAAAHAIGRPEDGAAIVDAALARRALWEDTPETLAAVEVEAARLDAGGRAPEDDTLVTVTAAVPAVRTALAEVAATRAARAAAAGPDVEALAAWERRAARIAREVVTRELAARAKAAADRFADLEILRPQLTGE